MFLFVSYWKEEEEGCLGFRDFRVPDLLYEFLVCVIEKTLGLSEFIALEIQFLK